jgi:hypothetical protein
MSGKDLPPQRPPRIADRLAAAQRGRFVGRETELNLFRSALLANEPPFAVLHLHGPGGIGKTALLRTYAQIAADCGRFVTYLDSRHCDPTPPAFLLALHQAMGREVKGVSLSIPGWPSTGVLLIDTYETLAPLDTWLRETFLPQLPGQSMVVIAGRNLPAPAWRTDLDWADLTCIVSLRNLRPDESHTFLAARNIPDEHHAKVLAFTHGHPLALALVADALSRGVHLTDFNPKNEPDLIRVLLERFVRDVPGPHHRQALEVCALAWFTTEALLADVLGNEQAHELFAWLRGLSFIEQGPYGLFPHDLAREVLNADLRWRDPDGYRRLQQQIAMSLRSRAKQTSGRELQRLRLNVFYANRTSPFMEPYFDWDAIGRAYAEPASPVEMPVMLEMVRRYEGDASACIAEYWMQRQPHAFLAFRTLEDELFGFMAHLSFGQCTAEDLATDPAVPAALNFAQRYGPVRPGEEILHLRFWMGRGSYQAVSPTINLTATNAVSAWVSHPKLAWNFVTMADPEFWQPHFHGIHMRRSPEADFDVGGRHYGVFAHDWRVQPVSAWEVAIAQQVPLTDVNPIQSQASLQPPLLVLSQPEFEEAVRQALRDYTRPDLLAANPLVRSRLLREMAKGETAVSTLQALLREALATLTANPKDQKFHRALWHTYFKPAPTQERAAELLDLPFSTYRYHLAGGIKRVTNWLWQRELDGGER